MALSLFDDRNRYGILILKTRILSVLSAHLFRRMARAAAIHVDRNGCSRLY